VLIGLSRAHLKMDLQSGSSPTDQDIRDSLVIQTPERYMFTSVPSNRPSNQDPNMEPAIVIETATCQLGKKLTFTSHYI
jgi:hypothetical protein